MTTGYTTITSKGQITLPVEVRRVLNLTSGQRLAVRVEDGHVVIDLPETVDSLRSRLRAEAESQGTWGDPPRSGEGWSAHIEDHHAKP